MEPKSLKPGLIRPAYSWVILASGFLVLFFGTGSRFAFGLVLKPMSEDLGWSRSTLTLGLTAFMLVSRSEEHTSELQSRTNLVCRLLLEKKKKKNFYL